MVGLVAEHETLKRETDKSLRQRECELTLLEQNLATAAEELASRERDAAHEHSAHENQLRAQESLLEPQ